MDDIQKKKLVVVTGGAGFVGSHLCERLVNDGHRVISLDNYFTGSKENHVEGVEYREGHTKDIATHISEDPDIIYHLGEYSRVEQSVLEPELVVDLNTVGTQGVIDFWREKRCKLIYAGSSTKFGDAGRTRFGSPYAKSKAENTEKVFEVGTKEKLPFAITYFYNVYGPGERSGIYGTVIEHFKRMYLSGAPCAVVSPGTQERNFTHVLDIVEGLVLVGERGEGDGYALGHSEAHAILDVVDMFGFSDIVFFPERRGNRMASDLNTEKSRVLGWNPVHTLAEYIHVFMTTHERGDQREKRVLVFSTTLHPVAGLAEDALKEITEQLPDVHFDIVTTKFSKENATEAFGENVSVYRIGFGYMWDKFLLPFLGVAVALRLRKEHNYLFTWSIMASYAGLAGVLYKLVTGSSLLITLADQNVDDLSFVQRKVLRAVLSGSDQVYGTHGEQEAGVIQKTGTTLPRNSLGEGDAFANALRYAYADIVAKARSV